MSTSYRWVSCTAFLSLLIFAIASCGSSDLAELDGDLSELAEKPDGEDGDADSSDSETAALGGVPAAQDGEDVCLGDIVPPRGAAGRAYFPATAVSQTAPFEELDRRARQQILDDVCIENVPCDTIEREVQIWERHEGAGYRCVMAIIDRQTRDEWIREVESSLPDRLVDRGQDVIGTLRGIAENDSPRVTIAEITDRGAPGGPRAEWLHRSIERALHQMDVHVIARRPDWSGYGVPDNVDGVIRAEIAALDEEHNPIEISWKVRSADRILRGESLVLPDFATPNVDEASHLPRLDINDDEVSLLFDSRDGGGLCHGQRTELWLETDEDMHVRVFNLYGNRSGHAIFPAIPGDDDLVRSGVPVSLGQFRAMRHGDIGAERFLVIASPNPESLDRYSSIDRFCRLPSSLAHSLQHGQDLPNSGDVYFHETGFRLMDGEECAEFSFDEREKQQILDIVRSAPSCW